METSIKYLLRFQTPPLRGRSTRVSFYKRSKKDKKEYNISIMKLTKLRDIPGYENDWGIKDTKIKTIWKNYK